MDYRWAFPYLSGMMSLTVTTTIVPSPYVTITLPIPTPAWLGNYAFTTSSWLPNFHNMFTTITLMYNEQKCQYKKGDIVKYTPKQASPEEYALYLIEDFNMFTGYRVKCVVDKSNSNTLKDMATKEMWIDVRRLEENSYRYVPKYNKLWLAINND